MRRTRVSGKARERATPPGCSQIRRTALGLILVGALAAALVGAGCATSSKPATTADLNYPYGEIEKVYETVLSSMLKRYYSDDLAAAKLHAGPLEAFVRNSLSKEEFVRMMTEHSRQTFDRARTDVPFRDSEEFKREFQVSVSVSVQMAMIMFAGRFDVYSRKIAHPDDLTRPLFPLARNRDEEEYVAWINEEVPVATVRAELGEKVTVNESDRFFQFGSPSWYWQQLAGRQGYLQIRDGKIIDAHITILN